MSNAFLNHLSSELEGLKSAGLYKSERVIASPQSAEIEVSGRKLLNFCANNYLGLADSEELRDAAKAALDRYGYGMASVRFICGTQEEHKQLEAQDLGLPRHGGHDPLRLLLRRQWRPVRDAARRGGRDHFRRAEPCLDHRRRPALQGEALPLRQQRHGRPGGQAEGGAGQPLPADRDRRRLLDGRHHRRPAAASATSRKNTMRW